MPLRRVSVIMPVLDEQARISKALDDLAAFASPHEVLVVDGGSRDRTCEIVEAHAGATLIHAARGRALQMNAAAREANGDVLLFLHADVTLPRDAPAWIDEALRDTDVVAGAFRTWTVADTSTPRWARLLHLADLRSRYSRHPYGDQALFVRKEAFWRLGGFPQQPLMEDLEFSRRLRGLGKIRTVPASVRVSGRRFIARPLYYLLVMNTFPLLYRLGVPARTLAGWYGMPR